MVLPPLPPPNTNAGNGLDEILQIVAKLECMGLLDEFLMAYPQYVVEAEVARSILLRGRNNNANLSGVGTPTACGRPQQVCGRVAAPNKPMGQACGQAAGACGKLGGPVKASISKEALPPPPSTDITGPPGIIGGCLAQRLASIPQPRPCFRTEEDEMLQRLALQRQLFEKNHPPPLVGTLEQRLAAIPEPAFCPLKGVEIECQPAPPKTPSCGVPKTANSKDFDEVRTTEKLYDPVAGGWSDGIGGHKIKVSPSSKAGGSSVATKGKQTVNLDGVGGRKVKAVEEE